MEVWKFSKDKAPTVKKKAIAAEAVSFSTEDPLKLSKIAIIIMEIPHPALPHIMGFLRPMRSAKKAGRRAPKKNIHWTLFDW